MKMEYRNFDITVISGNDLEVIRRLCTTKAYATVTIGGHDKKRTPTDVHSQTNPAWNFTMSFHVRESTVQHFNKMLVVKLFARRRLWWDLYIGQVHTPMKELFDHAKARGGSAILTLPVLKGSLVASKGSVSFSYRFLEKFVVDAESFAGWTQC